MYQKEKAKRTRRHRRGTLSGDAGFSFVDQTPTVSTKVGGSAGYDSEHTETETWTRSRPWKLVAPTTIQVDGGGSKLDGEMLSGVRGWFVKPDPLKDFSWIVASLTTRPEWIEFGRIDSDTSSGRIGKKLKRLMQRKKTRDRELFDLLLRTLAARGLQTALNRDATLAMHFQVLRKSLDSDTIDEERPMVIPAGPAMRSIPVDAGVIEHFLDADSRGRVELMRSQGVPSAELEGILDLHPANTLAQKGLFNAGSAPPSALEALKFALSHDQARIPTSVWDAANKNRSCRDLVALGLMSVDSGYVRALVSGETPAEDALRHAASKAPMLQATREILLRNPSASGLEIAEEMKRRFHRGYNARSSKVRVGTALRRWAIWLEPHLADPTGAGGAARLRVSARSERPGVGAPSLATPENIEKAQSALDGGMRAEDVAKLIGVSRSAFYGWGNRGILRIPKTRR